MECGSTGFSIHIGTLEGSPARISLHDEEEDEEELEAQRQRQQEVQGMLANAFDDLEDSDYQQQSSYQPNDGEDQRILGGIEYNWSHQRYSADDSYRAVADDKGDHRLSDGSRTEASVTPWSEPSRSLVSNHGDSFSENISREQVRLDLNKDNPSSLRAPDSGVDTQKFGRDVIVNEYQSDYLTADTPQEQLKLLYEMRGKEIDHLSAEVEQLRAEKLQQFSALQHEITLLKAEKDRLEVNRKQSQILLAERESLVRSLKSDLQQTSDKLSETKIENSKFSVKLEAANELVKTLQQNISDLKSSECLAKSQKMHDQFIEKLQATHHDELASVRSKLSAVQIEKQDLQHRCTELQGELQLCRDKYECVLMDKTRIVGELRATIEAQQSQCAGLLSSNRLICKREQEILAKCEELKSQNSKLYATLQEKTLPAVELENKNGGSSCSASNVLEMKEMITVLRAELDREKAMSSQTKDELENYRTAFKLGVLSCSPTDDSMAMLKMKVPALLNYEDSAENINQDSTSKFTSPLKESELIKNLKEELKNCLQLVQCKENQIREDNTELNKQIKLQQKLKAQLKSIQVDLKEQQNTNLRIVEERNKCNVMISDLQSQNLVMQEENTHLKQELAATFQKIVLLSKASRDMLNQIDSQIPGSDTDSEYMPSKLKNSVNVCVSALEAIMQVDDSLLKKVQNENIHSLKERSAATEQLTVFIGMLDTIDVKLSNVQAVDDTLTNTRQIYDSLRNFAANLKEDHAVLLERLTSKESHFWDLKIELEKMKVDADEQLASKARVKQLEQSLTNANKNFHEEQSKLEGQIKSLLCQLTDVKSSYVTLSREKTELEEKLRDDPRGSELSSEHVRLTINAIKQKHDEDIKALKAEHQMRLDEVSRKSASIDAAHLNSGSHVPLNKDLVHLLESLSNILSNKRYISKNDLEGNNNADLCDDSLRLIEALQTKLDEVLKMVINCNCITANAGSEDTFVRKTHEHVIEEYRKLIIQLKQEKMDLRNSYEKHIKLLTEQQELTTAAALDCRSPLEDVQTYINNNETEKLFRQVNNLQKTIEEMSNDHEQVVSKLSDEVQILEDRLKELEHNRSLDRIRFTKDLENKMVELALNREECTRIKAELVKVRAETKAKIKRIKMKYRILESNFDKLKKGSAEQVEHCLSEARRIRDNGLENRRQLVVSFQQYLDTTRGKLESGLRVVLETLKKRQLEDLDTGRSSCRLVQEAVEYAEAILSAVQNYKMKEKLQKFANVLKDELNKDFESKIG